MFDLVAEIKARIAAHIERYGAIQRHQAAAIRYAVYCAADRAEAYQRKHYKRREALRAIKEAMRNG